MRKSVCFSRSSYVFALMALVIAFIAVAFSALPCVARQRSYSLRDTMDLAIDADGNTIILNKHAGPCRLTAEDKIEPLFEFPERHTRNFIRFFDHPSDKDALLAATWLDADKKSGLGFYSFKEGKATFATFITERIRRPDFFQSDRGDIFIASRSGVIFWLKPDGDLLRYKVPLREGVALSVTKQFRQVEFTQFPGGPVCAWSIANTKYHERALFDVAVADPETGWQTVKLDGRVTGPAAMTNARTLKMLQYDRWLNIDIISGEVTETTFEVPREGDAKVKPILLIHADDGTLISWWRKTYRSFKADDIDPFENGLYKRICEWDGSQWKVIGGKDRSPSKDLTHVRDIRGGIWMPTDDGLMCRTPEGAIRHFDFRHGVPTTRAVRILTDDKNNIWLVEGGYRSLPSRLNLDEMLAKEDHPKTDWRIINSRRGIGFDEHSYHSRLAPILDMENKIICHHQPDVKLDWPQEYVNSQPGQGLLLEDNQGRAWVVDVSMTDGRAACFENGQWKGFDIKVDRELESAGNEWTTLQTALVWLDRQKAFDDIDQLKHNIVFGPNGWIAQASSRELNCFNGTDWYKLPLPEGARWVRSVSFTQTSIQFMQNIYTMFEGDLQLAVDNPIEMDWKARLTERGERGDHYTNRDFDNELFKTSPVPSSWNYRDGLRYFTYDKQQISLKLDEELNWTVLPNVQSPLNTLIWFGGIRRTSGGGLIFRLANHPNYKYALYTPPMPKVTVFESDLGEVETVEKGLKPQWNIELPSGEGWPSETGDLQLRFRIDSGAWSKWQAAADSVMTGAIGSQGDHSMQIQLSGTRHLFPVEPLQYKFTVSYDIGNSIDKLVGQLTSNVYKEREAAVKSLIELGPNVIPQLEKLQQEATNASERSGISRVIKLLRNH